MPRLAIVSTYNENCGNASYTHVLRNAFAEHVDVEVLPIDIFLLQKRADSFRAAADRHIEDLAKRLEDFDFVNIQFEAGLYGARIPDVLRRITRLIEAAPNLILTMHRIDTGNLPLGRALRDSFVLRSLRPLTKRSGGRKYASMYRSIVAVCRRQAREKNVWIKVHTRRERRVVTEILKFENCFDYPLAFLTEAERLDAAQYDDRAAFLKKHNFDEKDIVIGLFGYISEYKGIETAIKCLGELPDNYKLAIFGSHHPQSIQAHRQIHPYIESLLDVMEDVDDKSYSEAIKEARLKRLSKAPISIHNGDKVKHQEVHVPASLRERVRFVGTMPDAEFIEALRLADAAVLPYIEVGQSMSGVVVLGMEAGARIVAANNLSFGETRRYYGDAFHGFDIGNYVELAQKIELCLAQPERARFIGPREHAFEKYNIRNSALIQLDKFGYRMAVN